MANCLTRKTEDDGYAGYTDEVASDEGHTSSDRGIAIIKFSNDGEWLFNEEPIAAEREFMVGKVSREVVKWEDGLPSEESYTLKPGEPFPDIGALNKSVPRSEWHENPSGQLVGPWVAQHVPFLLDIADMSKFRFPTSTVGGSICVREIVDKTLDMRRFRPGAYPVVRLSSTFMKTRFGGRQRPFFQIVRWIGFDGEGETQLEQHSTKQLEATAKTVTADGQRKYDLSTDSAAESAPKAAQTLSEPSAKGEMRDNIRF